MSWSDLLQLAGIVGSLVCLVGGGIWWCIQRYLRYLWACIKKLDNQVKVLKDEKAKLQQQLVKANETVQSIKQTNADLKLTLKNRRKKIQSLLQLQKQSEAKLIDSEQKLAEITKELEAKIDALNEDIDALTAEKQKVVGDRDKAKLHLKEAKAEIGELKSQLEEIQKQIQETVEQKGRFWEIPLAEDAVPFTPLSLRQMPILSILNLKGGVGKTTITANLAAMLGMQGSRVLLIDLDYQRSLSLLCCSAGQLKQLHNSHRTLQHFLLDSQPDASHLLACATSIKGIENCSILVNSDPRHDGTEKGEKEGNLEDAEMHLLAGWLTKPSQVDVRLILRNALHSSLVREHFDFVLLDCPPRLSTACINALAASDFTIIPVMLDYTSAHSASHLLRKLHHLRTKDVLPELHVLGVLANRVTLFRGDLVNAQAVVWDELRKPCEVAWGGFVYFFNTWIKQSSAVGTAAARHASEKDSGSFAVHDADLYPIFHDLAQEVRKRIENESKHLAAVSS